MKFHLEVLGTKQQRALQQLGRILTERRFYLAGGTALALTLGHRRSIDLDWFTEERLKDPMQLAQSLREEGIHFVTGTVDRGTLHGTVSGLRVSLLEYSYPLLEPLLDWPAFGCQLASLPDLAAMKMSALAQRGAKKDFVDLHALLARHFTVPQMVNWYREKYGVRDIAHLLYSLAYFDDADRERMPRMLWSTTWRTVKRTIVDEVRAMSV